MNRTSETAKARRSRSLIGLRVLRVFVVSLVVATVPASAFAGDRYALLVSGASGGLDFATRFKLWRSSIASVLRVRFGYADDHLVELAEHEQGAIRKATRDNVRAVLGDLRRKVAKDDVLLIMLIGHGTATDADDAKFNLVGPDLTAGEWADLLRPIAGRVIFIDAASGSYPFLQKLAKPGRVVVTAADALGQQTETVFPEFLLSALIAVEADSDKNGKISIWEAFFYASRQVRDWFEQQGQLPSERPLLDDTGNGIGREAGAPGSDGALAQATYIDVDRQAEGAGSGESAAILKRRAELEAQMEQLRSRKADMPPDQYDAALEKLLLELAQIDRQLRSKS